MPNIKISQLGAAAPTTTHVVAADNAAGTITHKIALGDIPGLAAPQAHANSHGLGQSDPITIAAQQVVSAITPFPGNTIAEDITQFQGDISSLQTTTAAHTAALAALPGSFATASISYTQVGPVDPSYSTLAEELSASIADNSSQIYDFISSNYSQYMEGGWSPQIRTPNNAAVSGLTYTSSGYFIRVGSLVVIDGSFTITAVPSVVPAGAPWVTGLPYTIDEAGMGTIFQAAGFITGQHVLTLFGENAMPRARIRLRTPNASSPGGGFSDATFAIFNSASGFRLQMIYRTSDGL